jgi:hypothetical protein
MFCVFWHRLWITHPNIDQGIMDLGQLLNTESFSIVSFAGLAVRFVFNASYGGKYHFADLSEKLQ